MGEIVSASVFAVHSLTMLTDLIMRCTKTKGIIRSLVRIFTVSKSSRLIIRIIEFELQSLRCPYHFDVYSSASFSGEALGDPEFLGSLPSQLQWMHQGQQVQSVSCE